MKLRYLAIFIIFCLSLLSSYANADVLRLNGAETKAYATLSEGNYIKARQQSEEILSEDPGSFMGNYVLSGVFLHGEGNLLRGLQHHKLALQSFEAKFCVDAAIPATAELQKWHQQLIVELSEIYAELDDRPKQLSTLEHAESLYHSNLDSRKTWALMKMDRLQEARAMAEKYLSSSDEYSRTVAYNDLIAIEDSEYRYMASYEIAKRGAEVSHNNSCVILSNLARAAISLLRVPEATQALKQAKLATDLDCPSNPDSMLVRLSTQAGEYQKAISLAKAVRAEPPTKRMRVQTEKEQRAAFADLFFSMGYVQKAYELMKTVVEAPDRQGYNSYSAEKYFLSNMVPYSAMLSTYIERLQEKRAVYRSLSPLSFSFFKELHAQNKVIGELELRLWKAQQTILFHALNPATLRGILVPYHMIDNPNYQFIFMDMLGTSTSELLLSVEEQSLTKEELAAISPNSLALRAYIAWRRHDSDALERIEQALAKLPKELKLFVMQLQLLKADILYKSNAKEEAYLIYHEVMDKFPAAFRIYKLGVPVYFDSSDEDDEIAEALLRSDRFVEDDESLFGISITHEGVVQICLVNKNGHRYQCSSRDEKDIGIEEEGILVRIADDFLQRVFTPRVDLTQSDINSLDGSPVRIGADQALDELMN